MSETKFKLSDEQVAMLVREYKQYADVYGMEAFESMVNGFDFFVNNGLELIYTNDEALRLTNGGLQIMFFIFACGWEQCRKSSITIH